MTILLKRLIDKAKKFPAKKVLQRLFSIFAILIWLAIILAVFQFFQSPTSSDVLGQIPFSTRLVVSSIIATFGILSGFWLAWRLWKISEENQYITRQGVSQEPVYTSLPVKAYQQNIFPVLGFKPIVSALRRRIQISFADVDIEKTIEHALTHNNWIEIVYRQRQATPEYVVLIDRKSRLDQQARFVQELLNHLKSDGVFLQLYEFSGDPRICFHFDEKDTLVRLDDIQSRYPDARLLVFSGASELLNPLTGLLQGWLAPLMHWHERAILTSGQVDAFLLDALHSQNFVTLPMTLDGLAALVRTLESNNASFMTGLDEAPLPVAIAERPIRWTERDALPDAEVKGMLIELKTYLGKDSFYWLCACAVYPELRWELTLYLGSTLKNDVNHQPLLSVEALLQLARLPWFRIGYMPDWMRFALVESFLPKQEVSVRNLLSELLASAYQGPGFDLLFSTKTTGLFATGLRRFVNALIRKSAKESELRDHIFVDFILNQKIKKLSVQLVSSAIQNPSNISILFETFLMQLLNTQFRLQLINFFNTLSQSFQSLFTKNENKSEKNVHSFVEPPPAHQRKEQQSARLIMMLTGSGMLLLSMLGGAKLLWEILGDVSKPETTGAKLLWLSVLFLSGWLVSLINIRVLYDWVQPILIQGFIWLTLSGILAVYARIIIRLYNQDFVADHYIRYSLAFLAGFVALISLHLLMKDHDLRPCAIPLAALAFIHILVAGVHYVFRNDSDPAFAVGDASWLIFMIVMFFITAQNFPMLAPFRSLVNGLFPKK